MVKCSTCAPSARASMAPTVSHMTRVGSLHDHREPASARDMPHLRGTTIAWTSPRTTELVHVRGDLAHLGDVGTGRARALGASAARLA